MSVASPIQFWKRQKRVSQAPINFENGKNELLQRHAVLETAEIGHYNLRQILKRRIRKNDEARD